MLVFVSLFVLSPKTLILNYVNTHKSNKTNRFYSVFFCCFLANGMINELSASSNKIIYILLYKKLFGKFHIFNQV